MQGQRVGFDSSYRRYLDAEQRRAVLEAIGGTINPDSTLGEVIDAAEALGWSEQMGDLSLADLADALLAPEAEAEDDEHHSELATGTALTASDDEEDEDEDEDEDETDDYEYEDVDEEDDDDDDQLALVELPTPRARRSSTKKKASKKKATASAKKKSISKKSAASTKKKASKKATASSKKKASKKKASKKKVAKKKSTKRRSKIEAVDIDDRMSLEQAAEFFLPYVEDLGEATMQALEEDTGVARRKLRFHVGQLVRHGYLERHGMGRGTYYTVCE
ncbi:MAG: hypothetical protein AB1Z98_10385 [Nannocystaceae bacterium]